MVRKNKIIISCICLFAIVLVIVFTMKALSNSDKDVAEHIYSLKISTDYEEVRETYHDFLYRRCYKEIIEKYHVSVFESTPDKISLIVWEKYIFSLMATERYDLIEQAIYDYFNMDNTASTNIFIPLWVDVFSSNIIGIDDASKIIGVLDNMYKGNDEIRFHIKNLQYYMCSYFNKTEEKNKIDSEITDLLVKIGENSSQIYHNQRMGYISMLLVMDKYEDFKKMFVEEYSKRSFTGIDIVTMSSSGQLTQTQTGILIEALGELYLYVEENGNDKFLLEKIANVKGIVDGSISEDAE